jgi:dTDP-glucose 4,6-dehydratase
MNILVTGGCGFIGQHVVQKLKNQLVGPLDVWVLDKGTLASTGWDKVADLVGSLLVRGDVCDQPTVDALMSDVKFDLVMHLAAQSHVDVSLELPGETMYVNAVGTQVVASLCAEHGVPMLYCSTDEVYGPTAWGDQGGLHRMGPDDPLRPSSPYSAGKAAGELAVRAAGRSFGLKYAITRGCNAFGPGQYMEKLVPIACSLLSQGKPVPLHGGGGQVRQWVHVEEFAECLIKVGISLASGIEGNHGPVYNIAGPRICSVRDVVLAIAEVAGVDAAEAAVAVNERPGQDEAYAVCGHAMREDFALEPERDLMSQAEIKSLLAEYTGKEPKIAKFARELMRENPCVM